jgi:selenocysteine-specific elongation factor
MIIGTAGHIDHGKSTLIKAMTGIDPDRLKEEKARGITIDLGFAHVIFSDGTVAGIVDVPGHERLVHNMLAGAGGVDIALIVVAADEGVSQQTIEHVEILDLLGIQRAVVAITKIDLAGEDERAVVRLEVEELLDTTALLDVRVVETSAVTGQGLPELIEALESTALSVLEPALHRPFRMPLDRVFTLQGFGTVVTGTPLSGRVDLGQTLSVLPQGDDVRVRSIEIHGTRRDFAPARERVALNVTARRLSLRRGTLLAESGVFTATSTMDCRLRLLRTRSGKPAKTLQAKLFLGTAEVPVMVVPLEMEPLTPGTTEYAQIRAKQTLPAARGDRFVLRTEDDRLNLGGGIIIDAFAQKRGPRGGATARSLRAIDVSEDSEALVGFLQLGSTGMTVHELSRRLNLVPSRVAGLVEKLEIQERVARDAGEDTIIARTVLDPLAQLILGALSAYHSKNPLEPYVSLAKLNLKRFPGKRSIVESTLRYLSSKGRIVTSAQGIRLATHEVIFSPDRERTKERIILVCAEGKFRFPTKKDLGSRLTDGGYRDVDQVLDSLIKTGDLIPLSDELLISKDLLHQAQSTLLDPLRSPVGLTISTARELLDTTRKYLVPLFEYLDRCGFTLRRGDVRILSPSWGKPGGGKAD